MERSLKRLNASQLEQAIEVLAGLPGLCAAYLHGSALTGNGHPESDLDLAVLPMPMTGLNSMDRLGLATELESIFHCPVDLGILSYRNLVFCREVICKGELLYTRDRFASDLFAAQALSMYAELQQQRKEVLDAYAA